MTTVGTPLRLPEHVELEHTTFLATELNPIAGQVNPFPSSFVRACTFICT
jgi:hypothetical protein